MWIRDSRRFYIFSGRRWRDSECSKIPNRQKVQFVQQDPGNARNGKRLLLCACWPIRLLPPKVHKFKYTSSTTTSSSTYRLQYRSGRALVHVSDSYYSGERGIDKCIYSYFIFSCNRAVRVASLKSRDKLFPPPRDSLRDLYMYGQVAVCDDGWGTYS